MKIISSDSFAYTAKGDIKSYTVELIETDGTFSVKVTFSSTQSGFWNGTALKVQGVTKAAAQKVYDECVAERLGKGYVRA